jgi:hypothetical protein
MRSPVGFKFGFGDVMDDIRCSLSEFPSRSSMLPFVPHLYSTDQHSGSVSSLEVLSSASSQPVCHHDVLAR